MQRYEDFLKPPHIYAYLTLTLTHFILRVLLVDYEQAPLATYDLAIGGALLQ